MELTQIKSILHQTEVGELFIDGMGCSEPILSIKDEMLIDNFFIYLADQKVCTVSGPIARIGLQADSAVIDYLSPCVENQFSLGPKDTMRVVYPHLHAEDYEHYGCLYAEMRNIAYKPNCTDAEKQIIADYLTALKKSFHLRC